MANFKITELDSIGGDIDRAVDVLPVVDVTANQTKKGTINQLLSITGNPVGHTDSQTLTNKTISGASNTLTNLDPTQVTGLPAVAAIVTLTGSQTLTNKVLTSPTINTATIVNPTLTVDTVSEYTAANGVTVDGLNIKDSKLVTANSVVTANYTDGSILPEHLIASSGTSWIWQDWTPSLVNLSGGTINYSKYGQIGKTVHGSFRYTLGGAGVAGSVTISLPVTAAARYGSTTRQPIGQVSMVDTGTEEYGGALLITNSTTVGTIIVYGAGATYLTEGGISSTVPHTWASTDTIDVTFTYEAA